MQDWTTIAQKVEAAVVALFAYEEGELYSRGSGVVFNEDGYVLTAAHVLTGDKKLEAQEVIDGTVVVMGRTKASQAIRYIPVIIGPTFEADYFRTPVQIDTAILAPVSSVSTASFIIPAERAPAVGEPILACGFSEEVSSPFEFDSHIDPRTIAGFKDMDTFRAKLQEFNRFPLFKSAIVSLKFAGSFSESPERKLSVHTFYFDNVMHSGGSGGPIVDAEGGLLGIVSKRAVIELSEEDAAKGKIPSGSGLAITPEAILQYARMQGHTLS